MGVGRDFTLRSFHLHLSAKPDGTTGANAWLYGFSTRGSLRPWYRRRIGSGRKDQESRSNRYLPGLQPQAVLAPGTPQCWPRSIDPKVVCILRSEPALLNNTTLQTATTTASSGEGGVGQWPANGRPRYRGSPDHPPSSQNGGTAPDARRGAWAGQGGGASGACADNYRLGRASLPATNSSSPCAWRPADPARQQPRTRCGRAASPSSVPVTTD